MPHASFAIRADDYEAVVEFYIAVFGAVGLRPETVEDEVATTGFDGRLYIRDEQPGTLYAEVIVYASTVAQVDDAYDRGGANGDPPHEVPADDYGPAQYVATLFDPQGNLVRLVYSAPQIG